MIRILDQQESCDRPFPRNGLKAKSRVVIFSKKKIHTNTDLKQWLIFEQKYDVVSDEIVLYWHHVWDDNKKGPTFID